MKTNNKNHLSHIGVTFIMLLFVVCVTMNVLFCNTLNPNLFLDKTAIIEAWANSEITVSDGDGENTIYFNSYNDTITKNIRTISIIATLPKEISLQYFLIIVFLFHFLTLFILLPDGWTLRNQKVRLDI